MFINEILWLKYIFIGVAFVVVLVKYKTVKNIVMGIFKNKI